MGTNFQDKNEPLRQIIRRVVIDNGVQQHKYTIITSGWIAYYKAA